MNLYNKLKEYSTSDAIRFEQKDRQFLVLKDLYENKKIDDKNYLFLIIVNALICYQLSGKGEDYWEEFGTSLLIPLLIGEGNIDFLNIYNFFKTFIPESKNNRRFIDTKLKRVKKIESFYENFLGKSEYFYKNMDLLALELSKVMNQKIDAKTIVFAVKMFSYGARNIYNFEHFPENIMIPIDSRLENLYRLDKNIDKKNKINDLEIKEFYINLSKRLKIPLLHLDAILWVDYENLIK